MLSMPPRKMVRRASTLPSAHIARQRGVPEVRVCAMTSQSSRVTFRPPPAVALIEYDVCPAHPVNLQFLNVMFAPAEIRIRPGRMRLVMVCVPENVDEPVHMDSAPCGPITAAASADRGGMSSPCSNVAGGNTSSLGMVTDREADGPHRP